MNHFKLNTNYELKAIEDNWKFDNLVIKIIKIKTYGIHNALILIPNKYWNVHREIYIYDSFVNRIYTVKEL